MLKVYVRKANLVLFSEIISYHFALWTIECNENLKFKRAIEESIRFKRV